MNPNFGDIEDKYCQPETAKVVILPVAYDGTSTWIKGADKGPAAIIEASANMELYDIETDSEPYKNGIYTANAITGNWPPEEMTQDVRQKVADYISQNKFVVTVGGEHSVSIGAIKAYTKKYANLTVLQLDAHADLRDEYLGSKYNHACVTARVKEFCPVVQVGIRSMDISEKANLDAGRVFFAKDIYNDKSYIDGVIEMLSAQVYITIDLDVFDPSIMPSTGTPEPGGLLWYDILALLKAVCKNKDVVGFDVVELCPNKNNKAPDFLAAKVIYKMLAYKFAN
ncbi:MAG: agmatinase [Sedimentisphaerales bacterium]|nr:agmatinase [Sedimentisphaerales bacterium]